MVTEQRTADGRRLLMQEGTGADPCNLAEPRQQCLIKMQRASILEALLK